ncbi:MAG: PD-(D/E)XK nuclease family protein [Candidatus Thioglobus sp.]|uniref:PD-(D/E)XK nuclease family protein n=1 Tax=Candidatus Thioglobus sp. TaxID=2026721 RepID=UPI002603C4F8|nr:PD-(D/E)XK nuclease family protein [Candidatus Thioglobus sp.]MDC9727112.1 PD-(D/E)XK nuclease family protein [Candidatus Thioglobus sp.]
MHLNVDLGHLLATDTIVVANNRQVLAFKQSFTQQQPNTQLPKIFSWIQYLNHYWKTRQLHNQSRLINAIEQRHLIESSLKVCGQSSHPQLINEVVKNYDYCTNHQIPLSLLAQSKIQASEVFAQWISHYQQYKKTLNVIDTNDLASLILTDDKLTQSLFVYGFKTLTPLQDKVFKALNYQTLQLQQTQSTEQYCFNNTLDEIISAANWAKQQQQDNPHKSIAIVCPQLSELQHQLTSIFDQVFDDLLTETGQKSYNMSLGLPLSQYALIQDLLNLLTLSEQLKKDRIESSLFTQVVSSVYVKGYQSERSARHLLANQTSALALEYFSLERLEDALTQCPILSEILSQITHQTNTQTLDQHLTSFNATLEHWGFATDRNLSSGEYQLLQKYLDSSLILNQLSIHQEPCSTVIALQILKEITSQVIFQAQSSQSNIQIIGSLEAEGLRFDKAWVMGMTQGFLPAKLNSPRFISGAIAAEYQIPHSSYELIQTDAQNTFANLCALSDHVIFSYAKSHDESEQLPSPLLNDFYKHKPQEPFNVEAINLESVDNHSAPEFLDKHIKSGVSLLKDQMACAFKGFAHRLNIESVDEPHIGLDRREQGNVIHNALQYIYEEINTKEALLALSSSELNSLISRKVYAALKRHAESGFKIIEKARVEQLLAKFIETDKLREDFRVLATERSVSVDIAGLNFNTRLDRLDEMNNGDQIVFDYKTGATSTAKWCGAQIGEPQLPIYSITNNTQGAAFIELTSNGASFKGLSKDPDSLPKQSTRKGKCQDWDDQLATWKNQLNQASQDFQSGQAQVAPNKIACDYCEFDLLCRVQK